MQEDTYTSYDLKMKQWSHHNAMTDAKHDGELAHEATFERAQRIDAGARI